MASTTIPATGLRSIAATIRKMSTSVADDEQGEVVSDVRDQFCGSGSHPGELDDATDGQRGVLECFGRGDADLIGALGAVPAPRFAVAVDQQPRGTTVGENIISIARRYCGSSKVLGGR